ncbi:MAG: caspase family protein [Verrucomicrobiales bacterium]|nr:caspase family protein [Verrucomicrobiales bacterium]
MNSICKRCLTLVLIAFAYLDSSITCPAQGLQILNQPTVVKFGDGYDIIDNQGKVLKSLPGFQEANIQAYQDIPSGRIYMTDWSFKRWRTKGTLPNWIQPKRKVAPVSLPRPSPVLAQPPASSPEKRIAILIGNSKYRSAPLDNPANDVRDLMALFKKAGFETQALIDSDSAAMKQVLSGRKADLSRATSVVYFFAGHGFQAGGANYMLPIDFTMDVTSVGSLEKGVTLDSVLSDLEKYTSEGCVKMVVLDCCRNNPFTESADQGGRSIVGGKRIAKGLAAPSRTPRGTILCFSTDPGKVALDGEGRNSPYAAALRTHLFDQGVEINEALRRAGNLVQRSTNREQNPWRNTNFNGEFYVVPTPVRSYDTRMSILMDRDNEKVIVKFVTPLAADLSGIAGEKEGRNLVSDTVITIPSITAKGILGPSSNPNDDTGFQNQSGRLFGFNLQPATKSSYPYVFYRDQNGQIHLIDNLPQRVVKVLPGNLADWRGYFEGGGFLRIESIKEDVIVLHSFAWRNSNRVDIRFSISVDSRGNISFVN